MQEAPGGGGAAELLSLQAVSFSYGGVQAIADLDLTVRTATVTGLIGPNGAGKTTTFNLICGEIHPQGGEIRFHGLAINNLSPCQISRMGISRTFQEIHLFPSRTVREHVFLAQYARLRVGVVESIIGTRRSRREQREAEQRGFDILRRVGLEEYADMAAVHLPYGLQRRVEFARALAAAPRLILLDEPTAGMNVEESDQVVQLIRGLLDLEVTVLLVEHDMRVVMGVCSEVWVMNYGRIIARGSPQQIRNDPLVIEAYLGEQA